MEDIALLTLQKSILLVLSKILEKKIDLVEKSLTAMNEELPIVTIDRFEFVSNVKTYPVYQSIWVPKIDETLSTEREPDNPKDKSAVCIKKNECIVGHLPLAKTDNFVKTIFYVLRVEKYSICEVEITGNPVTLGDGKVSNFLVN